MDTDLVRGLVWFFGVIGYTGCCFLAAWAAMERGRSGRWFLIALVVTPVFAVLVLIAAGNKQEEQSPIQSTRRPATAPRRAVTATKTETTIAGPSSESKGGAERDAEEMPEL